MNRTWLTSVSTLALLTAFSAPAMADCVVEASGGDINVVCEELDDNGVEVNGNNEVNVDVLAGATVQNLDDTIADGDAVRVSSDGNVFFDSESDSTLNAVRNGIDIGTEDADITINNSSTIIAGGNGIHSRATFGNIAVTNSGAIDAGEEGISSFVDGAGNITVANSGTISADIDGIYSTVNGNGNIAVTNSGAIDAGDDGIASYVDTGSITVTNSGAIDADISGIFSWSDGNGDITVTNNGTIYAGTYGINSRINGDGNIVIANSGAISAAFDGIGSNLLGDGNIAVTNSGAVSGGRGISSDIQGDGTITVTNSGTITATDGDHGIFSIVRGDGISVTNSITVANNGTIDAGEDGILSDVRADGNIAVTNSGTISADIDGIYSTVNGNGNIAVTNSGEIHAGLGINSRINGDGNVTVTNLGEINAGFGGISSVVQGDGTIAVTNSSTISTLQGIYSFVGDTGEIIITNGGTINAGGRGIYSEVVDGAITIANSGAISARDEGIIVAGGTGNIVTHSGFVLAEGNAFRFAENEGNTLNLLAPGFIGGTIDLGDGTAVNITTGASHSVLWDFSTGVLEGGAPNVEGPGQFFFNDATRQFATIDPTGFAASFDSLGNLTNQLSDLGRQGISGQIGGGAQIYSFKDVEAVPSTADGLWAAAFGGLFQHDGDDTTLDRDIQQAGFGLGYRWGYEPGLDLGVMAGYAHDRSRADSRFVQDAHDAEADGFFIGVNARQNWGGVLLDLGLTGGVMSHEQDRFVNDNLAPLGESLASAEFDSRFISPEVGLSMNIDMGGGLTIAPGGRVRYSAQWLNGYTEEGAGAANASVDDRTLALIEATAELAATQKFDFGSVTGRVGVFNRSSVGDDDVSVTLIGQTQDIDFGTGDDLAGFAGLGVNIHSEDGWMLDVDGKAIFGDDVEALQGSARLTHRF